MDKKRKECKCKIRGVVSIFVIKGKENVYYSVHPDDWHKYLRKFKFCPMCGKELK